MFTTTDARAHTLPAKAEVLASMRLVNARFMAAWPDPGVDIVTNRTRPSNIWTRAVYHEGLMALHAIDSKPERIAAIKGNIDHVVASERASDWTWIDALQMAMPVYGKLGVLTGDENYFEKMHALYLDTRDKQGGHGLFNPADGLWWRDRTFVPPCKEPNGAKCHWSRGNGWVVAALVRVLDVLPADGPHRAEYGDMLRTMCAALKKVQRDDGFWNVSLHDPANFGGKETSGAALFAFGTAWGARNNVLSREEYLPVITKAWKAMITGAVHPDGHLGYVQGTGKEPKDGQPITYDSKPDFDDYGTGCFLLAGTEMYRLAN